MVVTKSNWDRIRLLDDNRERYYLFNTKDSHNPWADEGFFTSFGQSPFVSNLVASKWNSPWSIGKSKHIYIYIVTYIKIWYIVYKDTYGKDMFYLICTASIDVLNAAGSQQAFPGGQSGMDLIGPVSILKEIARSYWMLLWRSTRHRHKMVSWSWNVLCQHSNRF